MSDLIVIDRSTFDGFKSLFAGYPNAYGTGKGGWVHAAPGEAVWRNHLTGLGTGLGIGPLLPDGTCHFAAIDLDRPDFALAHEMMKLLPGVSWLERSRSGNAHVHVFFSSPVEAWVARGIMREALAALGQKTVEVFPKNDKLLPGMVGNYLNLPYFGHTRPIVSGRYMWEDGEWHTVDYDDAPSDGLGLGLFVKLALSERNDPNEWRKRAHWLGIPSPDERNQSKNTQFGTAPVLHMCGEYVIANRDTNPVREGHRAAVYFALSKMLANWSQVDDDEAMTMLALVNDASPDPISAQELGRIYSNARRGEFTSTSCDDPLFAPYRHPDCKIGD